MSWRVVQWRTRTCGWAGPTPAKLTEWMLFIVSPIAFSVPMFREDVHPYFGLVAVRLNKNAIIISHKYTSNSNVEDVLNQSCLTQNIFHEIVLCPIKWLVDMTYFNSSISIQIYLQLLVSCTWIYLSPFLLSSWCRIISDYICLHLQFYL